MGQFDKLVKKLINENTNIKEAVGSVNLNNKGNKGKLPGTWGVNVSNNKEKLTPRAADNFDDYYVYFVADGEIVKRFRLNSFFENKEIIDEFELTFLDVDEVIDWFPEITQFSDGKWKYIKDDGETCLYITFSPAANEYVFIVASYIHLREDEVLQIIEDDNEEQMQQALNKK